MVITPSSNIILLKTPIEISDNNQLTWSTKQEQYNYFNSLPQLSLLEATYQRKDKTIRFPTDQTITYEDLIEYNYCMYQNEAYNDKWFYAYITGIEYINDGMSTITIETDVWNTWCFDIELKKGFVEREHVNDDTFGLHTVPENLETGEYINIDSVELDYEDYYTCIAVSENLFDNSNEPARFYNGIASGLTYIILKTEDDVKKTIQLYNGKLDALYSIFMIPIGYNRNPNWLQWTFTFGSINITIDYAYVPSFGGAHVLGSANVSLPTSIDGYVPKNNKVKCYPYNFIRADNNSGTNVIYKYELFTNPSNCTFNCYGTINAGCSIKTIPAFYKNISLNYNESFNNAKLPLGSWLTDPYVNWLTQNGVNMNANVIKSIGGGIVAGMVTGGFAGGIGAVGGAIVGGINAIFNNVVEKKSHDIIPQQVEGNVNSSDIMFSINKIAPHFYRSCIKQEYAKIIDDYFTMFGYKVNSLKIPNIRGRRNWNYVKTIDCNIIGNVPQLDLEKIKKMFDNGITLWHHSNTFLDYSQDNSII